MERISTDICVIGAGSAGLSVAAGAVQMGARVVLVEGNRMGGDCLNFGCVPSKALIAASRQAHAMGRGAAFGIAPVRPQVDFAATAAHVKQVIAGIAPVDSQERFEGLGVRVIRDWARFTSERELVAGKHVIAARRFVIATGSSPRIPGIPGLEDVPYLTNETVFDLTELPRHLLVIGGGPIGIELAQAFRRLGSDVTLFQRGRALAKEDPELSAVVLDRLRAEGVTILENTAVERVRGAAGEINVETGGVVYRGSHLLVAAGRKPTLDRLDLAHAAVVLDGDGRIELDAGLRTSNRRIHAIGDAAGGAQFTHLAGYHASVVLRGLLFSLPARVRTDHIPRVTYADPELAQVGLTEDAARAIYGGRLEVVRSTYAENDRAAAFRETEGFLKLMVVSGRPVGVSIVGAQAGELIALWSLAIASRMKLSAVAGMVAPYPTLGELNKRAAGAYFSPRLFESPAVKRVVGLIQRWLP